MPAPTINGSSDYANIREAYERACLRYAWADYACEAPAEFWTYELMLFRQSARAKAQREMLALAALIRDLEQAWNIITPTADLLAAAGLKTSQDGPQIIIHFK